MCIDKFVTPGTQPTWRTRLTHVYVCMVILSGGPCLVHPEPNTVLCLHVLVLHEFGKFTTTKYE